MVDIVKELPEIFDEFADQRKESFLTVKELKDQDVPVVGAYCTYFPQELATAAGAVALGLCSTSDETIAEAEKDLPKNLCPLIKSSYGFAKTDKCPYFYFSDLVIAETTCDGKKKMYELMQEFKDFHLMELPNSQSDEAMELWVKEVEKAKDRIAEKFGKEITKEKLEEAIKIENRVREAKDSLAQVMANEPAPITGHELFAVLFGAQFKFDKEALVDELYEIRDQILEEYEGGKKLDSRPRILITGCPIGGATEKVIEAIESNGGVVVAYENCQGHKVYNDLVEEGTDDPIRAIARRYLDIGCSVMTPNQNRFDNMGEMIDFYKVDGVIDVILQACHTYSIETKSIGDFVREDKGIDYISVETDYSESDIGQLNTRISAFLEML